MGLINPTIAHSAGLLVAAAALATALLVDAREEVDRQAVASLLGKFRVGATGLLTPPEDEPSTVASAVRERRHQEESACSAFLTKHLPERDRGVIASVYLNRNIELALQARRAHEWTRLVPSELFLSYVLPYARYAGTCLFTCMYFPTATPRRFSVVTPSRHQKAFCLQFRRRTPSTVFAPTTPPYCPHPPLTTAGGKYRLSPAMPWLTVRCCQILQGVTQRCRRKSCKTTGVWLD